MTPDTQILDPKLLGFWTRVLRLSSNLSQDALATASGLTVRTIQRVEAGARANLTTRRCLARGLGYENRDIFDDVKFVNTVTSVMATIAVDRMKEEEARHPDHTKLEVAPLAGGAALAGLIDGSEAWCFYCDNAARPEVQQEAACIFDNLQDYGDIWCELSHSDRLQAQKNFDEMLQTFTAQGMKVYGGKRASRFADENLPGKTPLTFSIAYVYVVQAEQEISHILVPKKGRMLRCDDEVLLRFLCEMVHPIVRSDQKEAQQLVDTFNRHLAIDGFEIVPRTTISGREVYAARARTKTPAAINSDVRRVADALSSDQVFAQITRIETSITADPALAIGSAKEFVETLCKGILTAKGEALLGSESLPQLVKRVRAVLLLELDGATGDTVKRTLSALATLTQGIAELRGQLGSGHGHHPSTAQPSPTIARLAVGAATTLGVFLFDLYQDDPSRGEDAP